MSTQAIPGFINASATLTRYYMPYGGLGGQTTSQKASGIVSSNGTIKNLRIVLSGTCLLYTSPSPRD